MSTVAQNSPSGGNLQSKLNSVHEVTEFCAKRLQEVEESKKLSVASKKVLAEKTKAFMKLTPEESVNEISAILRIYQLEVESLSKRCRVSESAFHTVSDSLSAVTVPSKVNNDELVALQRQNADLEDELMKMKNQDITVRKLEARVRELESQRRQDMSLMDAEFTRRQEEIEQTYIQRLERMSTELESATAQRAALGAELVEAKSTSEHDNGKLNELLRSKQAEIWDLNTLVESLQEKLAVGIASKSETNIDLYKGLIESSDERISTLEKEISNTKEMLAKERAMAEAKQRESVNQVAELTRQSGIVKDELSRIAKLVGVSGSEGGQSDVSKAIADQVAYLKDSLRLRDQEISTVKENSESLLRELNILRAELSSAPSVGGAVEESGSSGTIPVGDDAFAILHSQRDRFKSRVLELESERDILKKSQFDLGNRLHHIETEKRKVENEREFWKAQHQGARDKPGDIELGGGLKTDSRSGPTLASNRRRANTGMRTDIAEFEQTLASLLAWGLGNPVTRRAGLIYLLTLHVLVFLVLYRLSSIVTRGS